MNGLHALNWVLWFTFLICIWDMPLYKSFITFVIVLTYGITERWIGQEEEREVLTWEFVNGIIKRMTKKQLFGFGICGAVTCLILLLSTSRIQPNAFPTELTTILLFFGVMGWFLSLYNFWSKK